MVVDGQAVAVIRFCSGHTRCPTLLISSWVCGLWDISRDISLFLFSEPKIEAVVTTESKTPVAEVYLLHIKLFQQFCKHLFLRTENLPAKNT